MVRGAGGPSVGDISSTRSTSGSRGTASQPRTEHTVPVPYSLVTLPKLQPLAHTPGEHLRHHRRREHPVQAFRWIFPVDLRECPQVRLGADPFPDVAGSRVHDPGNGTQRIVAFNRRPLVQGCRVSAVGAGEFHGGFLEGAKPG
jgi:hypothetical protein